MNTIYLIKDNTAFKKESEIFAGKEFKPYIEFLFKNPIPNR